MNGTANNISPPREDLPRISIDSLHDWTRIRTSYTNAATSALNTRLASSHVDDKRAEALRAHMNKLMENTFEMAKMNIRINGKNFEDMDADEQAGSEPFDEGFDRHIWALSDQSLNLDGEIAKFRREEPDRLSRVMQEILQKQKAIDEKEAELLVPDDNVEEEEEEDKTTLYENAETVMRKVYAMTEELQQSIASQHERTNRLGIVEREIKALKS
ncbi:hypothetical protein QCA50_014940 [Cerrena zonata]|uniref:Uncharacterized protein n=1 Tax=Cerrena zonata TaxID=2478898 RepID=A0AAW0FRS0_9APHY